MKRSRPLPALALWIALLAPFAGADVVVDTLDETGIRGVSFELNARELSVVTAEGPVRKFPTPRVVEIRAVPAPKGRASLFEVELTDGGRLRGALQGDDKGVPHLFAPHLAPKGNRIPLDVEKIRSVLRVTALSERSRLVRVPEKDAAFDQDGARVEGFVDRFQKDGVLLDRSPLKPRTIPYARLAALFVDQPPLERPKGIHAVALLADGSRVVLGSDFQVEGGRLQGTTPTGFRIATKVDRLVALLFEGGAFEHLSDRTPKQVKRTPFFPVPGGKPDPVYLDFVCPVRMDRSPDGRPITLRGRRFLKGIGLRPKTELVYALDGKYGEFRTLCGIDDEVLKGDYGRSAGRGSVVFRVVVDGKTVKETGIIEAGREPVALKIPIAGAKELRLIATWVPKPKARGGREDSPELDNAVWAMPLLVR